MNKNIIIVLGIIVIAVLSRLIPHPPNFTPIITIGLFAGAYIQNKRLALLIPLVIFLVSDLFIGFHSTIIWIYASIVVITLIGIRLQNNVKLQTVLTSSVVGVILFFLISNFGVWISGMVGYPLTITGLVSCYVAGLPFLQNTFAGTLLYSALIFGAYEIASKILLLNQVVRVKK
jgi:hypothetical protein